MALNFCFFGGRWVTDDELKREPNAEHINLYARLASLIRLDGLVESFNLAKSGRKYYELLARLSELSNLLTVQGGALHAAMRRVLLELMFLRTVPQRLN